MTPGEMNLINLFPTPLGGSDIGREFTKEEIYLIKNLKRSKNIGNEKSDDSYILEMPELAGLKELITSKIREYFHLTFNPKSGVNIYITQSWANYTDPGGYHHVHTHANSIVSGVLYVCTELDDSIRFTKPLSGSNISLGVDNWNIYNSKDWELSKILPGHVLLFPSTLKHEVPDTISNGERISIAFNTFVKGTIGESEYSTELHL
jgi:uncharacterized protein (TIGR02466 family)